MSWFQLDHMNIILLWLKRQDTDAGLIMLKMWQLINRQGQSKAPTEKEENMCYSNTDLHWNLIPPDCDSASRWITCAMCEVTKAYRLRTHENPWWTRKSPVTFRKEVVGEHMAYLKDSMRAPELWWWRWWWPVHLNTILLFYPLPACRWCFN